MDKLRIIIGGFIGLYPSGGVAWDYIQYPLGLKMMGHDVYYIEDTGQYSNYRVSERAWDDPFDSVDYLRKAMKEFGLDGRWAYRDTFSGKCYGLELKKVLEICSSADVIINVSNSTIKRSEYLTIPKRVLIDTDPMFTQVQSFEVQPTDKRFPVERMKLSDHNYFFSFGENIGQKDCRIPELSINWKPTRQPVCLGHWVKSTYKHNHNLDFTTVMNWSTRTKLKFDDEVWGQKDVEFKRFISIPTLFRDLSFNVVMAASAAFKEDVNYSLIRENGWNILKPENTVATTQAYKAFILNSGCEFSVAKETYVKSKSGWFSCRSACYLAAGKPVITQETGWSNYIPAGKGLFSFYDEATAKNAIENVRDNYAMHCKYAKEIAREYFDSNKVLNKLLETINSSGL